MEFEIIWKIIKNRNNSHWHYHHCLYALVHPENNRILYIGKAWKRTVKQRFKDQDKKSLYHYLKDEYDLNRVILMIGDVVSDVRRFTDEMLSDIESLLIKRTQPPGNIQGKSSRINRPEMIVICTGRWPNAPKRYIDKGW